MLDRLKLFFLNLYFYSLFLALSGIVIPTLTILVVTARLFLSHRETMKRFRRGISLYGKMITAIPYPFIRVRYDDRDAGKPGGPYIFVCNHRSASDPFLMCVLPHECIQIVNIWPFRIPVIGLYAKLSGYLNIRMMPHEQFMEKAGSLLRQGVSIIFFPEGTRSTSRTLGSFNGSAFRLALASKATVVPLCLTGSENRPAKGSLLLRSGAITVRRLPAITWNQYKDLTAFAFKNRVWHIIDRELADMEGGVS